MFIKFEDNQHNESLFGFLSRKHTVTGGNMQQIGKRYQDRMFANRMIFDYSDAAYRSTFVTNRSNINQCMLGMCLLATSTLQYKCKQNIKGFHLFFMSPIDGSIKVNQIYLQKAQTVQRRLLARIVVRFKFLNSEFYLRIVIFFIKKVYNKMKKRFWVRSPESQYSERS